MFRTPEEVAMHRHFDRDPTEFFSVVGAPYVRERHAGELDLYQRGNGEARARTPETGFATACAGLGAVLLGISLFASSGAARLGHVAYQAENAK
jgi:hypothetical protein